MADVVLLDLWVSPFGQRCRIALAAKGVAYEYREQDLSNKSELLLRSNPVHRMIPVLLDAGRPVCESLLIVQYIDEAWPIAPRLLPGDLYARAQARFWADFIDKKIFDCGTRLWKYNGAALEQATRDMIEALEALEAELGGKDYFGGEDLGFLDVALAPFTSWFRTYEQCGGFAVAEHCPGLAAWADRCRGRDDVASALTDPDKVYEFALRASLADPANAACIACMRFLAKKRTRVDPAYPRKLQNILQASATAAPETAQKQFLVPYAGWTASRAKGKLPILRSRTQPPPPPPESPSPQVACAAMATTANPAANPPGPPRSVAGIESTATAIPNARSAAAATGQLDVAKRKRLGTHVVAGSSSDAPPRAASKGKVSGRKGGANKTAAAKTAAKKAPVRKKASMAVLNAATAPVPADGDSPRPVEHESFVGMLNSASIDIDMEPLGEDYDEAAVDYEIGVDDGTDVECEEVTQTEGVTQEDVVGVLLDAAPAKNKSIRSSNYSELEDAALINAWESVSIDAVTGTDQTGKRYWQRIEDAFFHAMPRNATTAPRSYRSLQGRWDVIKNAVSRWSGCLEQVRNAPPSGTNIDDWDRIAMERYKQMPASKGRAFALHHCWKLLEFSEKWKLRDKEAPPAKGALSQLDDNEDDVLTHKKNSGRPDGNKSAKEKLRRQAEAAGLREKIDEMMKSKEHLVNKALETKMLIMERKSQEKQAKWELLRQDELRKAAVEEKRANADEKRAMAELIAEENKVMMMNPGNMDELTKEWWNLSRMEILARRREAAEARAAAEEAARAAASGGGGGGGGVDDTVTRGGA